MSEIPAGPTQWPADPPELQYRALTRRPAHDPTSWLWSLSMHATLAMVLTVMLAPSRNGHPGEYGGAFGVISAVFRNEVPKRKSTPADTKLTDITQVSAVAEPDTRSQVETAAAFRTFDAAPLRSEDLNTEPDSTVPEPVTADPELIETPHQVTPRQVTPRPKVSSKPGHHFAATPAPATTNDDNSRSQPAGAAAPSKHRETGLPGARVGHSTHSPRAQTGRAHGKSGTSFFGVQGTGKRFVYVIDCSASMSERETYAHARQELLKSLDLLPATALIQVIYYNDEPRAVAGGAQPALVRNTVAERRKIRQISQSVIAGGGTLHLPALQLALQLEPDVIYWLTDADEPLMTTAEVRRLKSDNPRQIPINAVEFGFGPALGVDNFLKRVARESGGLHQYYELSESGLPASP